VNDPFFFPIAKISIDRQCAETGPRVASAAIEVIRAVVIDFML
jgi:hypothetical protein